MGWHLQQLAIRSLLVLLACAPLAHAQTTPPEPVSNTAPIESGGPFTPAPTEITRLPSVTPADPPVAYYSQIAEPDDVPQFSPLFELAPKEVKLGWIGLAEVDYVKPFIHNGLNSGGPIGTLPEAVTVPTAQPPWTAMPRLDIGYRFEQGLGEFHAIFQCLTAQGTGTVANFDTAGAGTVTTRLNLNVLDLDYAYTEFNPGRVPRIIPLAIIPGRTGLNLRPEDDAYPMFRMKWAFGTRIANASARFTSRRPADSARARHE